MVQERSLGQSFSWSIIEVTHALFTHWAFWTLRLSRLVDNESSQFDSRLASIYFESILAPGLSAARGYNGTSTSSFQLQMRALTRRLKRLKGTGAWRLGESTGDRQHPAVRVKRVQAPASVLSPVRKGMLTCNEVSLFDETLYRFCTRRSMSSGSLS